MGVSGRLILFLGDVEVQYEVSAPTEVDACELDCRRDMSGVVFAMYRKGTSRGNDIYNIHDIQLNNEQKTKKSTKSTPFKHIIH